jgi:hypothetical protein
MALALPIKRPVLTPGWSRNELTRKAKAAPSLDLRFADNKSLVDATTGQNLVTFTRASSGTYVDSQGLIKTAVTNLLLRSEEFDVTWGKPAGVTVTANTTEAPNGTQTADTLSGAINIDHNGTNLSQSITATESKSYIFSIYVKSLTATTFSIRLRDNTAASAITAITPTSSWQRVSCTLTTGIGATTLVARVGGANGDVAIWGAQLEQSSTVGEYIPTTSTINSAPRFDHNPTTGESLGLLVEEQRTNLALQSEAFDSASWAKPGGTTCSTNAVTAPDGSTAADKLVEFNGTVNQAFEQTITLALGTAYSISIYVKAAGRSQCRVAGRVSGNWSVFPSGRFDLSAGTVLSSTGDKAATISEVGNGWFRCTIYGTSAVGTSAGLIVSPLLTGGTTSTYAGDGTSGIYIWGTQLEAGAFPTSYIPTTTATVTRSADVASITGSNFSSWGSSTTGTYYLDAVATRSSTSAAKVFLGTSTSPAESYYLYQVQNQSDLRTFDSTSVLDTVNTISDGVAFKGAVAYSSAALTRSLNLDGGLVVEGAFDGIYGSDLFIGSRSAGGAPMNGTIRRLTYWPQRLPNSTLQTLTQ